MSAIDSLRRAAQSLALAGAVAACAAPESLGRSVATASSAKLWPAAYFAPHEFASKGNGAIHVQPRMVAALDATRAALGRPIRILSGYRDPAWNARIGGAPNSRHMHGDAVDIDLRGYDAWTRYVLVWRLIENGFTSFGTYGGKPNLLHADMRPRAAIWRHGGGGHPQWLRRALDEWRWRPVTGSPFR